MAEIVVIKGDDGKLQGLGEKASRAFDRFKRATEEMAVGDTMRFGFWIPRAPGPHRAHFKLLHAIFDQQEQFDDADEFRKWVEVGAGFCTFVPGPGGRMVALPKSIAWDRLEEADFEEHHRKVVRFMRSPHFTRFLWPAMTDLAADTLINNLLAQFGE